jgi:hypothetical protein
LNVEPGGEMRLIETTDLKNWAGSRSAQSRLPHLEAIRKQVLANEVF